MSKHPIRISASRVKTLWDCSLKFYYQEILGLPDSVHWRTKVGSCVHLVFECLMHRTRPRRAEAFRHIMVTGTFRAADYAPLIRFIQWQLRREDIADKVTVSDIEQLLHVAFLGIRQYFTTTSEDGTVTYTPPSDYRNEQRFQITLPSGAVISGFIDLLLLWPDRAVCIDLKTQKDKFVRAELPSNIQAAIYELAVMMEHDVVPAVEFVLVRHAPTKRNPLLHIQRVEPHSRATLGGLVQYIDAIYVGVNKMTFDQAMENVESDSGFCERVCTHYAPHAYWEVCRKDDPEGISPVSRHLVLDKANEAAHSGGYLVIERWHAGCAAKWRG
jgi:hypothetical protein